MILFSIGYEISSTIFTDNGSRLTFNYLFIRQISNSMFKKHRKMTSMPLLCCVETQTFRPTIVLAQKKSIKGQKISLKQSRPIQPHLVKPVLHKKTLNKQKGIKFQTLHPKILFSYTSPKKIQDNLKALQFIVPQKDQSESEIYVIKVSQSKQVIHQQDQRLLVSSRMHHRTSYSELKIQSMQEKIDDFEKQKDDNHSLRTQKVRRYVPAEEETETVNYKKQEKKGRDELQNDQNIEQSLFINQHSYHSKSDSQQIKPNEFYSSENLQFDMNKWKKINNFNTVNDFLQRKQRRFNNRTVELNREAYKQGKLFERVRLIETKLSDNDELSSSSHHSEVIEDYKSLLVKLQSNKLQDQQQYAYI